MDRLTKVNVEYNKRQFEIDVESEYTVGDLKTAIFKATGLETTRQNFVNLDLKERNIEDKSKLDNLNLTSDFIVVVTAGSIEEPKAGTSGASHGAIPKTVEKLRLPLQELHLSKEGEVTRTPGFKFLNKLRQDKHLLVLDIDKTIYDLEAMFTQYRHRGIRPYLQQFLVSAYQEYDIVLWSATDMNAIESKLNVLGIINQEKYKIAFCLDYEAMPIVRTSAKKGRKVKQLDKIWYKFRQYNKKNTIICDDTSRNFLANPENGLEVMPYSHKNYESDKELLSLEKYLKYIAQFPDFSVLDHTSWRECVAEKCEEEKP